jgi:hypothetical protein
MVNRYIRFFLNGVKSIKEEKGISFKQLIIFTIIILLVTYATIKGVDKNIIIALVYTVLNSSAVSKPKSQAEERV